MRKNQYSEGVQQLKKGSNRGTSVPLDNCPVSYFPTHAFYLLLLLLHLHLLLLLLHLLLHPLQVLLQPTCLFPDDRAEQVVPIPEINIHIILRIEKKGHHILNPAVKIPQVPLQRSLLASGVKYRQPLVHPPWVIHGQARVHARIDHEGIPLVPRLPSRACQVKRSLLLSHLASFRGFRK